MRPRYELLYVLRSVRPAGRGARFVPSGADACGASLGVMRPLSGVGRPYVNAYVASRYFRHSLILEIVLRSSIRIRFCFTSFRRFVMAAPAVTVHLIYSDGRCRDEDIWRAYSIALFPFMLGVPPQQVYLTANEKILRCDRQRNDVESSVATEKDGIPPYFPNGYHGYFSEICANQTSGFNEMGDLPAPVDIRVVSGHGFGAGCQMCMRSSHGNTLFSEIPTMASLLTIFDILRIKLSRYKFSYRNLYIHIYKFIDILCHFITH